MDDRKQNHKESTFLLVVMGTNERLGHNRDFSNGYLLPDTPQNSGVESLAVNPSQHIRLAAGSIVGASSIGSCYENLMGLDLLAAFLFVCRRIGSVHYLKRNDIRRPARYSYFSLVLFVRYFLVVMVDG